MPVPHPGDDYRAIEALMMDYAWHLDAGDFDAMAELFTDGVWFGQRGRGAVLDWLRSNIVLYEGRPRTHHVVSNVQISIDADALQARGRCYITVLHQLPSEREIHTIAANTYEDVFVKVQGDWRFASRDIERRLVGEVERHRRV